LNFAFFVGGIFSKYDIIKTKVIKITSNYSYTLRTLISASGEDSVVAYSNLLKNNVLKYLDFVKKGEISLGEILVDLSRLDKDIPQRNLIVYEIFKFFVLQNYKEHAINLLITEYSSLGLKKEEAYLLAWSKFVEVKFPIVEADKVTLARCLVFKVDFSFSNNPQVNDILAVLEKKINAKISVLFDRGFVGESFELAVAVGRLVDHIPENLAFTGRVAEDGKILKVENFDEKLAYCNKNNIGLISYINVSYISEIIDFLNEKEFHIPILLRFSSKPQDIESLWKRLKERVLAFSGKGCESNCNLFERIYQAQLTYSVNRELSEDEFYEHIEKSYGIIRNVIDNSGIPHIAINGPAAFALGLGIALGAKDKLVVYHYQGDYFPVLDLTTEQNLRLIKTVTMSKEMLQELTYEVLEHSTNKRKAILAIELASHKLLSSVKEYAKENIPDGFIIHVMPKNMEASGNISLGDWKKIVSELFSITQIVRTDFYYDELHIFLSCPVPIAFGFGMALGDFVPGKIYNYFKGGKTKKAGYVPVLDINEILR
jgi:hypothetical protein